MDAAIDGLSSMIEGLMMITVGAMVCVILIAMYLPMFKMLRLVQPERLILLRARPRGWDGSPLGCGVWGLDVMF